MTSPTSAVSIRLRSAIAFSTVAPSCWGWIPESAPLPNLPMPLGVRQASMIQASFIGCSSIFMGSSTWRHADRAVEAHILAVEIAAGDHRMRELGVFLRPPEASRERNGSGERRFDVFRRPLQQRRVEDARQDGVAADALAREVARHDKGDADDARFRGGIGGLTDLSVFRGH